jgi:hypothetical protein
VIRIQALGIEQSQQESTTNHINIKTARPAPSNTNMMLKMRAFLLQTMILVLLMVSTVDAATRRKARSKKELYYGVSIDIDEVKDYAWSFLKLTLACSPILAIVAILMMANEGEEDEEAKREHAAKTASFKS